MGVWQSSSFMGCLDLCQPNEPEGLPRVMPDPYTYTQEPWEDGESRSEGGARLGW